MPLTTLGTVRAPGTDGAFGIYAYHAGAGAAAITIGGLGFVGKGYLSSIAATASVAGASVQIDAGDLIPVPVGGSVAVDLEFGIYVDFAHPHTITFVGTDSYLVDWLTE